MQHHNRLFLLNFQWIFCIFQLFQTVFFRIWNFWGFAQMIFISCLFTMTFYHPYQNLFFKHVYSKWPQSRVGLEDKRKFAHIARARKNILVARIFKFLVWSHKYFWFRKEFDSNNGRFLKNEFLHFVCLRLSLLKNSIFLSVKIFGILFKC